MQKRVRNLLFVIIALMPFSGYAQREPCWMNEVPTATNSSIVYERESGEGSTIAEALSRALARVMQTTANRIGQPFDAAAISVALQQGSTIEVISAQYNLPIRKVDQYDMRMNDGSYRVFVLCQVAHWGNVTPEWEPLPRCGESNDWTAAIKSAILPGLGQMGKGHTASGVFTLCGEAILVGSGIACYYDAQKQLVIMRDASVPYDTFVKARNRYNAVRNVSFVAWSGAGILYVYNIIRAFTMQPQRAVEISALTLPSFTGPVPAVMLTYNF